MVARQLDSNNFPQWVLPQLPPRRCFFSKNSILSIMEDDDCFEVALDVSSYRPEELQVLDILFLPNHNIYKSSCGLCFWGSDPFIERF